MRTLQEKYNAIQEGTFSKDHFLAEARMQQPQLITRFNGYDDAVQILKNKGMIQEAKKAEGRKVTDHPFVVYTDKQGKHHIEEQNYEDDQKAFLKTIPNTWDVFETKKEALAEKERRLKGDKKETVKEAKLTKKSLTDYRYKPTNDMDKYPYEQILRGLRVELEAAGVLGTPTPEEYSKALAKVSKNLAKDSIFYTNQVAGVNPKVDLHDKMVPFTAKTTVDTFNGMKKAELKEGFDIKSVLRKLGWAGETWTPQELASQIKKLDNSTLIAWSKGNKGIPNTPLAFQMKVVDAEMKRRGLDKDANEAFNGMKKAELKEGFKKLIKKVLSESMGDMFGDKERAERSANYGQPGEDEYEFYSDPENYNDAEEEFELQGEEDEDDISHPRGYEEASDEEDLAESKMGDVYQIAQEYDRFEDFVQAVEQEFGPVEDIAELEYIFNSTRKEDDLYEVRKAKSLSELLK